MSSIDTFVEECLRILETCPPMAPECPLDSSRIAPGSFWLSRSTGRRATLLWASGGRVCLSYDETRIHARKIHRLTDFARLYTEAR